MEVQVTPARQAETFVRLEEKLLIPKAMGPKLLALLSAHLDPSYPDPTTRFSRMESLYFDSEDLWVFRSHFTTSTGGSRFKLRIRKYYPNGMPTNEPSWLELKSKENGISKKFRFQIGKPEERLLAEGKGLILTDVLFAMNSSLKPEHLAKRVAHVSRLVEEIKLRPKMCVSYNRRAFERDGFRVTVDDSLQSRICQGSEGVFSECKCSEEVSDRASAMAASYHEGEDWVLELKHLNGIPAWMMDFILEHNLPNASFSKYCYCVSRALKDLRGRTVA